MRQLWLNGRITWAKEQLLYFGGAQANVSCAQFCMMLPLLCAGNRAVATVRVAHGAIKAHYNIVAP